MVEIGGGEVGIVVRQEAPGAVVEALAVDVHVVGVQHPVHEPGRHPAGDEVRAVRHDPSHQTGGFRLQIARVRRGVVEAHDMLHELTDLFAPVQEGVALEGAEADRGEGQPRQHRRTRRRGFVAPFQRFARFEQREAPGGGHAQRLQHLGGQHLAHAALQCQPPVAEARVRRLARTLGGQVQQPPAHISPLAHLGVEEAPAVADLGVVSLELVAVVAGGQRLREVARQRLEAGEGGLPFGRRQRLQPHRGGGAIVAVAQVGLRKAGRRDGVGELGTEREEGRLRAIGGGNGHGGSPAPPPSRGQALASARPGD